MPTVLNWLLVLIFFSAEAAMVILFCITLIFGDKKDRTTMRWREVFYGIGVGAGIFSQALLIIGLASFDGWVIHEAAKGKYPWWVIWVGNAPILLFLIAIGLNDLWLRKTIKKQELTSQ